jgi:hypothetical protein
MNIIKTILIITIIPILATSITICNAASIVNDVSTIVNDIPSIVNDMPSIVNNMPTMVNMDLNESYISLYSKPAISMAGERKTIPRRASSYGISVDKLTKPIFSTLNNAEAKERLMSYGPMLLGKKAIQRDVKDNGSTFALDMESGIAWIAKYTGAFELKTHDGKRGRTIVKNADHAVNLALEQIAESGLLKLSRYETLDVVSVTSTHYAGWIEKDGQLKPVYFDDGKGGDSVAQFKSEYTVNFGRRYRDVPIIGPPLSVKLDAEGRMVAFRKSWRKIIGETEAPAEILSEKEIEARRNPELAKEHHLKQIRCGYVEGPAIGYRQESPGVGCHYVYYNSNNEEALAGELDEWINISPGSSESLIGKRVSNVSGPQAPTEGEDFDTPIKVTTVEMNIPKGWSLISLPVLPDNRLAKKLFPQATVIYGYEKGTGYTCMGNTKELEVGKGYWILADEEKNYTITGQEIPEYTLPVNAEGWYMIGGCSFPAEISVYNGTIITIYKHVPGTGYIRILESENIEQGKGYWILVRDINGQAQIRINTGNPH